MLVKLCFSLHFVPLDPDPQTQMKADPNGSGTASLRKWPNVKKFYIQNLVKNPGKMSRKQFCCISVSKHFLCWARIWWISTLIPPAFIFERNFSNSGKLVRLYIGKIKECKGKYCYLQGIKRYIFCSWKISKLKYELSKGIKEAKYKKTERRSTQRKLQWLILRALLDNAFR